MSEPKTPEGLLARARRLQEFLNDETITDAFSRLERKYFEEFKAAKSAEERARAQGKANLLDDFAKEFQTVLDAGERAVYEIAKAQKDKKP